MQLNDITRLRHMIDAAESAPRFVEGRTREDLGTDEMLAFALLHAVEIIGEAASRVSKEGQQEFPEVPWKAVIGMRNRLVHAYFDVDHNVLWSTVTGALPPLASQLRAALSSASE